MPSIVNELRKRRQGKDAEKAHTKAAGPAESSAEATLDWDHLRKLSLRPGGFGEQRVELWKQLLNVEPQPSGQPEADRTLENATKVNSATSEPHRDERQIQLDTDRSFVLYPVGDMSERKRRQEELHDLIVGVFRKRRTLHYFQGYHDIMSVLYLTLPPELQLPVAEKLSLHRLRDAMGPGLEPLMGQLCLLQRVLRQADPEYAALLEGAGPVPIYALSNLLTLFSHDMPTLPLIQHVFDYLLARPPVASVYLAAAVLLVRKKEAQRLEEVGEEGMLHSILNSLPDIYDDEDCEDAVGDAASDAPHPASDEPSAENPGEKISSLAEERHTDGLGAHEASSGSAEPAEIGGSPPDVPDSIDTPRSPLAHSEADESVLSHPDDSTLVDDSRSPSEADTSLPEVPEEDHTLVSDISEKKSGHAHDPSIETAGSFHTAPEDEVLSGTEPTITVDDSPAVSPIEAEDSIRRPRVHLSTLLTCADTLFARFPPMDASVDLPSVMGPQSVMLTWSEDPTRLPRDDDAEKMVLQPHLVVHGLPREFGGKEGEEAESEQDRKRKRRKLQKRRRLRPSPTVVTAMIALGVAVAVYHAQVAPERQHAHMREMKKLGKLAGGAVLGFGGRLWDGLVAMAG